MTEYWVKLTGRFFEEQPEAYCPVQLSLTGEVKVFRGLTYIGKPEGKIIGEFNEDAEKITLSPKETQEKTT